MLLTLLSTVFGGVLRLLPEVMTWLHQRQSDTHELEMTKLQMQIDQARASQQMDAAAATAAANLQMTQLQGMIEAAKAEAAPLPAPVEGHWFYNFCEMLSKSVRPILTYWWCIGLYTMQKGFTIAQAIGAKATIAQFVPIVFTDFDAQVVGSIIGFWFMDRAISKGQGLTTGVAGRDPSNGFTVSAG